MSQHSIGIGVMQIDYKQARRVTVCKTVLSCKLIINSFILPFTSLHFARYEEYSCVNKLQPVILYEKGLLHYIS